jgi:hypothetical protein
MAMTLVSTVTVGSGGASSIQFTSIPQTGKDLLVLVSGRASWASAIRGQIEFQFNSSSTGYSAKAFGGYNSALFQQNDTSADRIRLLNSIPAALATANTFNNVALYVANYTSSTAKSVSLDGAMENNAATSGLGIVAGNWSITNAIDTVRVSHDQDNFVQHSTASLYIIS